MIARINGRSTDYAGAGKVIAGIDQGAEIRTGDRSDQHRIDHLHLGLGKVQLEWIKER